MYRKNSTKQIKTTLPNNIFLHKQLLLQPFTNLSAVSQFFVVAYFPLILFTTKNNCLLIFSSNVSFYTVVIFNMLSLLFTLLSFYLQIYFSLIGQYFLFYLFSSIHLNLTPYILQIHFFFPSFW